MALITVQSAATDVGLALTMNAASSGGDTFSNASGNVVLVFDNQDAASRTITITTVQTVSGLAVSDRTITVLAGEKLMAGPFNKSLYNGVSDIVSLAYDDETNLDVAAIAI